jgi:LacI family transcriptional regulator
VTAKSTIYEVAARSGVSTATVSRVMRDGRGFSEQTRDRVLSASRELGWVPNASARRLAGRHAGVVGLLFPDLGVAADIENESPLYVDQVIRGAERAATLAGDGILIAATHSSAGIDLAWSVAGKVDGLVVLATSVSEKDLKAISGSVPVVVLGCTAPGRSLDYVVTDNRGGARALTTHLTTAHGYRDLAFIAGPAGSPDSEERFTGYREALAEAGLPVPDAPDAHGGFTEAGGERAMTELLAARGRPPRAVVVGNDEMAVTALAVLRAHRLRVPADVALTGFDDLAAVRHLRPALTTVRQPMRESGEAAVRMLLDRLREPGAPRRTLMLPTELVLRSSCGCTTARTRTTPEKQGGQR